jgi:hypothetical protein
MKEKLMPSTPSRPRLFAILVPSLALALAIVPSTGVASTDADLEAGMLQALRAGADGRQARAGAAIRAYKDASALPSRPQRSDYTDYYPVIKPTRFMGQQLVLVSEQYMIKHIGCCVDPGTGMYIRVLTNTDAMKAFARINHCRVRKFADSKALHDSTPATFGLEAGRYAALLCHESDELATSAPTPAPERAPTQPPQSVNSPLTGDWTCQSRKANGAGYQSAFRFTRDGAFVYADANSRMSGRYTPHASGASITMEQVSVNERAMPSSMKVEIANVNARPGQLLFEMSLVRLNSLSLHHCVTPAVAAATPASKVNVCDVNPAACAAIQRNHETRSQVQDWRCQTLRSQLAGVPGGDYQLAKAGCR